MVRVGGLQESPDAVLDRAGHTWARGNAKTPFAYPWYDAYDTGAAETVLVDGDLLAPLLLLAAPDLDRLPDAARVAERARGRASQCRQGCCRR